MYTAQTTKNRIKELCRSKKINMENMLSDCSLGVNSVRQINDTKGLASFSLAKIADYLECSVDYLLGRTDTPELNPAAAENSAVYPPEIQSIIDKLEQLNPRGLDAAFGSVTALLQNIQYIKTTGESLTAG